jgi:hypothetical protein
VEAEDDPLMPAAGYFPETLHCNRSLQGRTTKHPSGMNKLLHTPPDFNVTNSPYCQRSAFTY